MACRCQPFWLMRRCTAWMVRLSGPWRSACAGSPPTTMTTSRATARYWRGTPGGSGSAPRLGVQCPLSALRLGRRRWWRLRPRFVARRLPRFRLALFGPLVSVILPLPGRVRRRQGQGLREGREPVPQACANSCHFSPLRRQLFKIVHPIKRFHDSVHFGFAANFFFSLSNNSGLCVLMSCRSVVLSLAFRKIARALGGKSLVTSLTATATTPARVD